MNVETKKVLTTTLLGFDELRQGFLRDGHSLRISAMLHERSRTLMEPLFRVDDAGDDAVSSRERWITLVDGQMEWSIQSTSLLDDIQQAIQRTPALQITGSHFIPTTKQKVQLLVVDLRPELALARVLFRAAQSSLVAQSPSLRFTCGLVSSLEEEEEEEGGRRGVVGKCYYRHFK